jgi:NAD(P)-dependent dehydrogenase (short-subunit alcohol dehydrogenase family)
MVYDSNAKVYDLTAIDNGGIYRGGKLAHEFSDEDLDACFAANVKGTFFGSQEAVKQFLRQKNGGNIINLVSTAGLQRTPETVRLQHIQRRAG